MSTLNQAIENERLRIENENLRIENEELREKLKKTRKEKKRWKRKYLGLKAETEPLDFFAPKKVVGEEEIKIRW